MADLLVTLDDLTEPACACGHSLRLHHPEDSDRYDVNWHADWSQQAAGVRCPCTLSGNGVRLAHLDSIVRREAAKALRAAGAVLREERVVARPGPGAGWAAALLDERADDLVGGAGS